MSHLLLLMSETFVNEKNCPYPLQNSKMNKSTIEGTLSASLP